MTAPRCTKGRGRVFAKGVQPVKVAEVHDTKRKRPCPKHPDSKCPRKPKKRNVTGEPLKWSPDQQTEALACLEPLWKLAERHEKRNAKPGLRRGRPRLHKVVEAFLFEALVSIYNGYRAVERKLQDPHNWNRFRVAVEQAFPDNPTRRLSSRPITRSQYHYYREHHMSEDAMADIKRALNTFHLEAAADMEMLDPDRGSVTHPDPTQIGTGDGTWIKGRYTHGAEGSYDEDGNQIRRYDPDSVQYHDQAYKYTGTAFGRKLLLLILRNSHRAERLILDHEFMTDEPEGTTFTDMVLNLKAENPTLTQGLRGITFDMGLHPKDIDRLMDAGLITLVKVPRAKGTRPKTLTLGPHNFTHPLTGHTLTLDLTAVDGTPCINIYHTDQHDYYQPLERKQTKLNTNTTKYTHYGRWAIPHTHIVNPALAGAITTIRHSSTTAERKAKPHRRRTIALREIPETDPDFDQLHGLREDPESTNSQIKSLLAGNRARTDTLRRQEINMIFYRLFLLNRCLTSYYTRTGKDPSRWYGQHHPIRAGPLQKAA